MKRTKENLIKLLKAKILKEGRMEEWCKKKGNLERAEVWKRLRWNTEEFLELLTNYEKFNDEWDLHKWEIAEVEKVNFYL